MVKRVAFLLWAIMLAHPAAAQSPASTPEREAVEEYNELLRRIQDRHFSSFRSECFAADRLGLLWNEQILGPDVFGIDGALTVGIFEIDFAQGTTRLREYWVFEDAGQLDYVGDASDRGPAEWSAVESRALADVREFFGGTIPALTKEACSARRMIIYFPGSCRHGGGLCRDEKE